MSTKPKDPEVVKTLDIIHPNDDLSNPILAGWYKKTKMDFFYNFWFSQIKNIIIT